MIFRSALFITVALLALTSFAAAIELKDVQYTTKDAGKVIFSHKSHLQKKTRTTPNFSCKTCHEAGKVKERHFTMAEMEKGKSCGACHDGTRAFALSRCTQCHKVREITYEVKETGPVSFSHKGHLRTMQCGACHNGIFRAGPNPRVTMAEMEKGKSCGACHNGKGTFRIGECVRCHPVKEKTYAVKDAGNVPFSHKFHISAYSCGECHPRLYAPGRGNTTASMGDMEKGKSCGACHDGKTAFTVRENCEKCHKTS